MTSSSLHDTMHIRHHIPSSVILYSDASSPGFRSTIGTLRPFTTAMASLLSHHAVLKQHALFMTVQASNQGGGRKGISKRKGPFGIPNFLCGFVAKHSLALILAVQGGLESTILESGKLEYSEPKAVVQLGASRCVVGPGSSTGSTRGQICCN